MPDTIDPKQFEGVGRPIEKYRGRDVMQDMRGLLSTASGSRRAASDHRKRADELDVHADRFELKAAYLAEKFLAPLEGATPEQIAYLEVLEEEHDKLARLGQMTEEQLEGLERGIELIELGEFITEIAAQQE